MAAAKEKVAVIGSGFGGLSAAIRLACAGYDVSIYEKLDKPGGRAYQYEMDGFRFDAGPTVITAPHQYDELFELAGEKREDHLHFTPLNPFYRIFKTPDNYFDYWREQEKIEEEIAKFNSDDIEGYRNFISNIEKIFHWFYPFTEKSFTSLNSFSGILPGVARTGTWRSMYGFASKWIKDDFLKQVTSFHPLLVGGNPFDTPSIYGLIIQFEKQWGIHYCEGGTGAIVKALTNLFLKVGGKLMLNAEVDEILIENKKVKGVSLKDGSRHDAHQVICNSDITFTYKNLIANQYRPKLTDLYLSSVEYSNSLMVIYFGTKIDYADSKLSHHNLILGKDYNKLMSEIFNKKKLPRELGLYLHMPSRTDNAIAPKGCGSFYVLSLVPNLDANINWEETSERYCERILAFLEENYLPGLRENIMVKHVVNPLHFKNTLNSYKGAAFSIKPSMLQSGYFRPQVKSKHLKGLYFVGAGVHPGAGVPAVMASGKIAAAEIMNPRSASV